MSDFETVRARNALMDDESKEAIDRIEAEVERLRAQVEGLLEVEFENRQTIDNLQLMLDDAEARNALAEEKE